MHCPNSAPVSESTPTREELRKKLRQKVRGKRGASSSSMPQNVQQCEEILLRMAGDDPQALQITLAALRDPSVAQRAFLNTPSSVAVQHANKDPSDDEEAPPPSRIESRVQSEDEEEAPPVTFFSKDCP